MLSRPWWHDTAKWHKIIEELTLMPNYYIYLRFSRQTLVIKFTFFIQLELVSRAEILLLKLICWNLWAWLFLSIFKIKARTTPNEKKYIFHSVFKKLCFASQVKYNFRSNFISNSIMTCTLKWNISVMINDHACVLELFCWGLSKLWECRHFTNKFVLMEIFKSPMIFAC